MKREVEPNRPQFVLDEHIYFFCQLSNILFIFRCGSCWIGVSNCVVCVSVFVFHHHYCHFHQWSLVDDPMQDLSFMIQSKCVQIKKNKSLPTLHWDSLAYSLCVHICRCDIQNFDHTLWIELSKWQWIQWFTCNKKRRKIEIKLLIQME